MRPLHALGLFIAALAFVQCSDGLAPPVPDGARDSGPGDGGDASKPPSAPPNIILVLTDDLSWNLVRFMPAVREMRKHGLTFTNYFVTDSLCCPSRSSIFTGKYPHDTGVFTNSGRFGGYKQFELLENQKRTFATALTAAGYRTAMMGKYLNGYLPDKHKPAVGWSEWDVAGDGYAEFNYALNQNGTVNNYGSEPSEYLTDVLSRLANRFVEESISGPFMLEVATFAPHAPYVPAPRYVGQFSAKAPRAPSFARANVNPPRWLSEWPKLTPTDIADLDRDFNLRVEAVQAVDDLIDSLRKKLAAAGADKNTYLVFSSDNGFHMGEHMLEVGKKTAFDTDIRVPLVIEGPGVPAGVEDAHIVENIDLCPTFAELAGRSPSTDVDGHSLVPLLRGEKVASWRTFALVEHVGPDIAPADPGDPDQDPARGPEPNSYTALRTSDFVFVEYYDGEKEYYDHTTDPFERTNTAASLPHATVKAFEDRIARIRNCHSNAECWSAQQ